MRVVRVGLVLIAVVMLTIVASIGVLVMAIALTDLAGAIGRLADTRKTGWSYGVWTGSAAPVVLGLELVSSMMTYVRTVVLLATVTRGLTVLDWF